MGIPLSLNEHRILMDLMDFEHSVSFIWVMISKCDISSVFNSLGLGPAVLFDMQFLSCKTLFHILYSQTCVVFLVP